MDKPDLEQIKAALAKLKKFSGGKTFYAGSDIYEVLQLIFSSYRNKYIKVRELFEELHELGFGFVLFFAGLIGAFIPFFGGFLPVFFGIQMLLGKSSPWIPQFIANKKINIQKVRDNFKDHKPKFDYVNKFLKHRFEFFSSVLGERILGAIIVICGASILIPLPATNLFPGLAVMIIGLGYLTKDGIVIAIAASLGILASLFSFGVAGATLFAVSQGLDNLG